MIGRSLRLGSPWLHGPSDGSGSSHGSGTKNRGAYGAGRDSQQPTAECKESKGLRVKNQVLGEATDAETDGVVAVVRGDAAAASRAAVPGVEEP